MTPVVTMTPIVIQAGGFGTRLHPITEHNPKPLLKVGGKPILETIIDGFREQGFKKFWLVVHYKADLIRDYFGDGTGRGVNINYIHEENPLGTGGAINLLPTWDRPFIMTNGDILTKVDYGRLMEFHARSNALATVCAGLFQQQIPYGVLDYDENRLHSIREKPIENFAVNAGLYVLEPDVRQYAPEGAFGMPDLIDRLPKQGARSGVAVYPLENHWYDVGCFVEYARANAEWSH